MQRVDDGRVGCGVGAFSDPAEIYLGLEAYRFQSPVSATDGRAVFLVVENEKMLPCVVGFMTGAVARSRRCE